MEKMYTVVTYKDGIGQVYNSKFVFKSLEAAREFVKGMAMLDKQFEHEGLTREIVDLDVYPL